MIYLPDLSELMQRAIDKDFVFMVSKSGIPNYYSIYFSYCYKVSKNIRFTFSEVENIIFKHADEHNEAIVFNDVDNLLNYVEKELKS